MKRPYLILLYLFAIIQGLHLWTSSVLDPDLGWQLFGGAWLLDHGAVPDHDPINSLSPFWHNYHWLAQLLLIFAYESGGYLYLKVLLGLVAAYLFKIILDICVIKIGRKKPILLLLVFFLGATLLVSFVTSIRPQIFSLLIIALVLRRLIQPITNWEIPYIFLLTVIGANIHVYWCFIPILWVLYRLVPQLIRRKVPSSSALLTTILLSLCGFLTPYGWRSYELLWEYLNIDPFLRSTIHEFRPSLGLGGYTPALILLCIAVAVRTFRTRYALARASDFGAILLGFALALKSIKFISLFSIFSIPFLIRPAGVALRKYAPSLFREELALTKILLIGLFGVSLYSTIVPIPTAQEIEKPLRWRYPVDACEKLAELKLTKQPERDHVRILTHFDHGGWCRWAIFQKDPTLDYRVTTDGRTQYVPIEYYRWSFSLFELEKGWQRTLKSWAPDAIVVGLNSALAQGLELYPEWDKVYSDKNFAIFLPGPEAANELPLPIVSP